MREKKKTLSGTYSEDRVGGRGEYRWREEEGGPNWSSVSMA
jgi:hypothetical protein